MAFFGCDRLAKVELNQMPETVDEMLFTGTHVEEVRLPRKQHLNLNVQPLSGVQAVVLPEGLQMITANSFAR